MDNDKTQSLTSSHFAGIRPDLVHCLMVMSGPDAGRRVELKEGSALLGRSEEVELRIVDPGISSKHCRVIYGGGLVLIEDLGSTNGTYVDRVRVHGLEPLPVGSILQVGTTLLVHDSRSRGELLREERLVGELQRAREYVFSLLPPPVDAGPIRAFWKYIPCAELGGDAFGYHWLDKDRFVIYLLDVCGHGTRAALHSVSVVNVLRRKALRGVDFAKPDDVLSALNRSFPMEEFAGMYFTIWYGVYQASSRTLTYATGGHPPALLAKDGAGPGLPLRTKGPGVGMLGGAAKFSSAVVSVDAGSRLYLYSDGLFEVRIEDEEFWSVEGLLEVLGSEPATGPTELDRVENAIRERMVGDAFEDDFSLLVAEFP